MGAREDLLHAAKRLTQRGQSPFSPAELIEEARGAGCAYPDTRNLADRAHGPLSQAGIEVWLVDEAGSVREVGSTR
jgi:hypothetical protein